MTDKQGLTRRWAATAFSLATLGALEFRHAVAAPPSSKPKRGPDAVSTAAVAEVNGLGVRLFAHMLDRGDDNVVISPLSIAVAMQMAAAGANGATEQEFRRGLALGDGSMEEVTNELGSLLQSLLKQEKEVILRAANGIWLATDARPVAAYVKAQQQDFSAEVKSVDFARPSTKDGINKWFSDKTNHLIPKMLSQLSTDTRVVLANALYFKGRWQTPFKAALTAPGMFHVAGKQAGTLPLMHRKDGTFLYQETERGQAVRLPFAGRDFNVVVVLPRQEMAAVDVAKSLDDKGWSELLDDKGYEQRPGELTLPRLKLSSGADMRTALEAIGLKGVFSDDADFSRLSQTRVKLDQVIHRAVLSWDEEGAEAAAATAAVVVRSVSVHPAAFTMVVDRPFLMALKHAPTGALVLLGLVNNPAGSVS
jgi:serpin B